MKLDLAPMPGHAATPASPLLGALSAWYARTARVRRLWAIEPAGGPAASVAALRVVVMLEPVADSDEMGTAWMARGRTWQDELRSQLAREVDLEWMADALDDVEIDGEGTVVAALFWRDPTTPQG